MLDFTCMGFRRAVGNEKQAKKKSKWKYIPQSGIEPATPRIPRVASNQSATLTVNDLLLELLYYFGIVTMQVWN